MRFVPSPWLAAVNCKRSSEAGGFQFELATVAYPTNLTKR